MLQQGDFNGFLEVYAASLAAQERKTRRQVPLRIGDVWERFQGKWGLYRAEALCCALHEVGCDADTAEKVKDVYFASLANEEAPMVTQAGLATQLQAALRAYISGSAKLEK